MKGDFSRIRFNPKKQYTAVLEQQGRVSLDADANEQCAIDGYLRKTETIDVIGEYGAPANDAGFAITVDHNEILIGAGRYYVEGLMCENRQDNLPYGSQPYLIGPSPSDSTLLADLVQQGGSVEVFLEVWQRLVTALDDPCLREPALGQADTTARLQTVWRVVAGLVEPPQTQPNPAGTGTSRFPTGTVRGGGLLLNAKEMVAPMQAALKTTKVSAQTAKKNLTLANQAAAALASTAVSPTAVAPSPAPAAPTVDCCVQMYGEKHPVSTGSMGAMTSGGTQNCSCQPIPAAGYQGLENQLYRVEIHHPGDETTATFKWSRENASVVVAIRSINGATIWVDSLGPDANLGFQANEWVEITDDTYLFGQVPNQPGTLYQILLVDPTGPSITMTTPVIPVDTNRNARVRRWEQTGTAAGPSGLPLPVGSWLTLENGIEVSFGSGTYHSGDYWTIAARTASGLIDWPPCGSDGNLFQPAHSTIVYHAPLACIHWDSSKRQLVVEPCRRIFAPLTSLTPPAMPPALHITGYSWQNDDITTFDLLLKSGLTLTLDAAPTGPISGANVIVTIETMDTSLIYGYRQQLASVSGEPAAATTASGAATPPAPAALQATSIYTPVFQTLPLNVSVLDWQTSINTTAKQILWSLPKTDLTGLQSRYLQLINDNLLGIMAEFGIHARARVKLLGDAIFAQSGATQLFLDGQSFGVQTTRQDKKTPCISLQMPSGNGEKASDFEGWFYLAPFNRVSQVSTNYASFTVVVDSFGGVTGVVAGTPPQPVTAQVTVQLSYPAATVAGTTVSLALAATTSGVNASNYVSLQTTNLVIPQGTTQKSVNINVFGNPGQGQTYTFQITASVQLAYGSPVAQSTTFTLVGVQASPGRIGRIPVVQNP
jgi:hypothetical protein